MSLQVNLLQKLMISVDGTFVPIEVLVPFHASLEVGNKLPVRNMAPILCGGELLAEERHRALLLQ